MLQEVNKLRRKALALNLEMNYAVIPALPRGNQDTYNIIPGADSDHNVNIFPADSIMNIYMEALSFAFFNVLHGEAV